MFFNKSCRACAQLPAHAFGGSDFEDRRFTVPPRSRPRRQEHSESDEFAFGSRDARYHSVCERTVWAGESNYVVTTIAVTLNFTCLVSSVLVPDF